MSSHDFSKDIAFVTGATSGIGRAVALQLGKAGARTVLTGIGEEIGREIVGEIEAEGGAAAFVTGILDDSSGWKPLYEAAAAAFGPISIFVHCASPQRKENQTVLRVTEAEWDAMINTNLRSGFFLAQAVAKRMRTERIAGRMVFMTSLHAETPRNLPHYSAAKAGQAMIVRELARALGPDGIRVNGVAPGAITGGGFEADPGPMEKCIPLGRCGTQEDIAAATHALLSDQHCGYVTGAILAVDGGLASYNWIERPANLD